MVTRSGAVLALVFVLSLLSQAQAQWQLPPIGKGFKGGVGISNALNHEKETGIKTAYLIGGLFSYRQNDWFSFQMEALYTSKGYTIDDVQVILQDTASVDTGIADAEIILGYIEIPVVAKFTAPLEGKYRPYFLGGGFMAISVISKTRFTGRLTAIDVDIDNAETVDLGAVAAAGIDIKMGDGWMFFETRYDRSFVPTIKDRDQKVHTLYFQLGYWW